MVNILNTGQMNVGMHDIVFTWCTESVMKIIFSLVETIYSQLEVLYTMLHTHTRVIHSPAQKVVTIQQRVTHDCASILDKIKTYCFQIVHPYISIQTDFYTCYYSKSAIAAVVCVCI